MATVPNIAMGKDVTAGTLVGMTKGATGLLTASGSPVSILAWYENINPSRKRGMAQPSPTFSPYDNNVPTSSGTDFDITGYVMENDVAGTPTNVVSDLFDAFDYVKLVYTRAGRVITYIGTPSGYKEIQREKNEIKFEFNLLMVDIGGPNPAYS